MASLVGWGDLPPDIFARIADALPIKACTRARAICAAWRAAVPPASPSPLVLLLDCRRHSTWRLSPRVSTALDESRATVSCSSWSSCIGSGDGWVAVHDPNWFGLANPLTGEVIYIVEFHSLPRHSVPRRGLLVVSKVVFAPNPTLSDDFTAAAITGRDHVVTYTVEGNSGWTDVECPRLADIADVVYHEERVGERAVYCLGRSGDVHVLRLPASGGHEPAAFEPLFDNDGTVFDAAAAFGPPYDTIRECAGEKNLVVCDGGDMYQIWRNDTCARTRPLPGGGECHVEKNQVFVLRYYPHRRPCWVAVEDLGGRSVFVGKNNSVALRVDGGGGDTPGLKANCVYWIDTSHCPPRAKVFDMVTGKSEQCFPGEADHSVICWYF